jgi:hypothetical protein
MIREACSHDSSRLRDELCSIGKQLERHINQTRNLHCRVDDATVYGDQTTSWKEVVYEILWTPTRLSVYLPTQWRQFFKERVSGKGYNIHESVSSPVLQYFSLADGNESDEGDTTASSCA